MREQKKKKTTKTYDSFDAEPKPNFFQINKRTIFFSVRKKMTEKELF